MSHQHQIEPSHTHPLRLSLLAGAISLSLASMASTPTHAATIDVINGGCTLEDAITSANDDSATLSCGAGSGDDTIVLQNSSVHSFALSNNSTDGSNALPSITSVITIQGNDATIKRDSIASATDFRLFHVAAGGDLTLDSVTVSGGVASGINARSNSGGALFNRGSVTLNNSTLSGNSASNDGGGFYNASAHTGTFAVTLSNSTLSGNSAGLRGGGLFNKSSSVTLNNSTLSGNSADKSGGGVYNSLSILILNNSTLSENSATYGGGSFSVMSAVMLNNSTLSKNNASKSGGGISNNSSGVTLNNSTLSGNTAGINGGGLYSLSNGIATLNSSTLSGNSAHNGAGLWTISSNVTLSNSTLSGNSATNKGGGGYIINSDATLSNSTLSANSATANGGGGLFNSGSTVTLSNSILANSIGSQDCSQSGGTVTADSSNIIKDDGCATSALAVDPLLGPLADNGGSTQTHALLAGSPAIDAGNSAICAAAPVNGKDQRDIPRPQGASCDIGAYEWEKSSFFIIPLPGKKTVIFGL